MTTTVTCLKVGSIRSKGYDNLREWMETDPDNVYTGRRGRIFIAKNGEKEIFNYEGSKWENPYPLKQYELKDSLRLYVIHLFNSGLIYEIDELRGKNLGCYCETQRDKKGDPICHAQILADLLDRCYETVEKLIRIREKYRDMLNKYAAEFEAKNPSKKIDRGVVLNRILEYVKEDSHWDNERILSTAIFKEMYNLSSKPQLVPSSYDGPNKVGDFAWMIKRPEYSDALFIFNDNEEAFTKVSCKKGQGNAVIRPYQCEKPPRSTGISTGNYIPGVVNAGYSSLTPSAKKMIDNGIQKLRDILAAGSYKRVFYSANKKGELGTGIFRVGDDVKKYIVSELKRAVDSYL